MEQSIYRKLTITRANVEFDRDIGALPGDEESKVGPLLRGRSLTRQILYVDEAQNTSPSQMKGILTRVGEGTKLVISGDLNQIDNPRLDKHNNGLAYALKLLLERREDDVLKCL
ncbi:PhoH family protein [Enterocloster clostridioformis]|uniref:PhoH family protein n=1 Tax=Enterocloster clostridioformis TaxID=1531 RepID=UPI0026772C89|nr:PhoH family protein [Enterocloster clostridioformis]